MRRHRRLRPSSVLGVVAIVVTIVWSATSAATDNSGQEVICKVSATDPDREQTVTVAYGAAKKLLHQTPSYPGRCVTRGPKSALGDGWVRTFVQSDHGVPGVVGVEFPSSTLQNLPQESSDGQRCYDVDGDGTTDPMMECAGGWARPLSMPAGPVVPPLKWSLVNWNPHGHGAPGVYTYPHFDFHFYLQPKAEVDAIRSGPCGIVVNCDDYATGIKPIPEEYFPPGYSDIGAVEVKMGNHLIHQGGPEWHGEPFMRTLVFGGYDGKVSFIEPMISLAFFQQVRSRQTPNGCYPVPQPQAWQAAGWYPQQYCVNYRASRDDFTVTLAGFRHS